MRHRFEKIPGVILSVLEDPDAFQKPLQIAVQGDDIATLKQYAAALKTELYTVPGIVDVEATMEQDLPEYRLVVDRERAAASGLGSGAVANTVALLVGGQAVTTYEDEEGEAVNVRVRLPQALRGDVTQVGDLKLHACRAPQGPALVPLADLVTFTPRDVAGRDQPARPVAAGDRGRQPRRPAARHRGHPGDDGRRDGSSWRPATSSCWAATPR